MRRISAIAAALVMALVLGAASAYAGGTIPGTVISNTATATYTVGVSTITSTSNTTTLTVVELLDVTVTEQDAAKTVLVAPGAVNRMLTFRVTNTGNGSEAFTLTPDVLVAGDDYNPTLVSTYLDTNNNGVYDAGTDTLYVAGTNDPVLAADAFKTIFVFCDIPGGVLDTQTGKATLTAASKTGTGAPGTLFAGLGDTGADAVAGASGGDGADTGIYLVSNVTVTVVKSQVVTDAFGGAKPMPTATVTYTITVTVTGTGTATGVMLTDPIPANTAYTAGTLTLNAGGLTDASGDDAGDVGATTPGVVTVSLGNLTSASAVQTIVFAVTIN
ncbi:MAG: DUF11 domain-containing protein [Deltaproteobacteria bacterium]|nr:DUF11 domain-containing protein [Deltaproteobacteria bacterium]